MSDKMIRGYAQLPYANTEILFSLPSSPRLLYLSILLAFDFEEFVEDKTSDKEWIIGKLRVRKADVIKRCNFTERIFYYKAWDQLLKSGLIREEKGWIILPRYRLKPDAGNGQSEIGEKENTDDKNRIDKIEIAIEKLTKAVFAVLEQQKGVAIPEPPAEAQQEEKESDAEMSPEGLAEYFLRLAGHKVDNKAIKNVAPQIIESLETYSYEDIAFSIEYICETSKEKPQTFQYVKNGMARALGVKEKEKARESKRAEIEQEKHNEKQSYLKEEEERDKVTEYKNRLSQEQRIELRALATQELEKTTRKEIITDMLIGFKENEILRKRMFGE